MNDPNATPPSDSGAPVPATPQPHQQPLEAWVTKAFVGPNGIRSGWRLLMFLAIAEVLPTAATLVILSLGRGDLLRVQFTPPFLIWTEGAQFLAVLFASWVMGKMEQRTIGDYGLPLRGAFGVKFWQGAAIGFASITALLVAMQLAGVFHFGEISLHGAAMLKYAAEWGAAFLFVGFSEEFTFRGYALFTLTTGMTFWPSAIVLSICFGLVHLGNGGESWAGVFSAGMVGFLFCLILRRTGSLWMPIGFHVAWDWGETYFYGVPDSGLAGPGHLFNASFSGPAWLTGGTVGPEGSWLCIALLVVLWVIFAMWLRQVKYPNPDALAPKKRVDELPKLFPSES
jgi:CAAX protease family protein